MTDSVQASELPMHQRRLDAAQARAANEARLKEERDARGEESFLEPSGSMPLRKPPTAAESVKAAERKLSAEELRAIDSAAQELAAVVKRAQDKLDNDDPAYSPAQLKEIAQAETPEEVCAWIQEHEEGFAVHLDESNDLFERTVLHYLGR